MFNIVKIGEERLHDMGSDTPVLKLVAYINPAQENFGIFKLGILE